MAVRLDEARRTLVSDGAEWPFRLDLRRGHAFVQTPSGERRVRPQRWAEKRRLAQFAGWGEAFFREQLWSMCVSPADAAANEAERDAVLELALWLTAGGRLRDSLPYDRVLLANATFSACRALGLAPSQLDSLPAYEAESLWRCSQSEPDTPAPQPQPHQEFTHQIVVVPDAPRAAYSEPLAAGTNENTPASIEAREPEPSPPAAARAVAKRPSTRANATPKQRPAPAQADVAAEAARQNPLAPAVTSLPSLSTNASQPAATAPAVPSSNIPGSTWPTGRVNKPTRRTFGLSKFRVVMGQQERPVVGTQSGANREFAEATHAERIQHDFPGAVAATQPDYFFLNVPQTARENRFPLVPSNEATGLSASATTAPKPRPAFDAFADEFADRLKAAAGELGILEGL